MKRNLLLWAVCAVMMAFTACTQEKVVYVEGENDMSSSMQLEGNVLKISLSNGLSRAVRPIYDNEATNNINRIGFKFLAQDGTEVSGITIEQVTVSGSSNVTIKNETEKEEAEEAGGTVEGKDFYPDNIVKINNDDYDTEAILSIYLNMEAAKGQHIRIIAYGYNDAGDEAFPETNISTSGDSYGERLLKLEGVTNKNLPEYFAGYKDVAVNIYGLFDESPEIVLERQVAGLLVYLEKIPAYVNKTENDPVKVGYITVSAAKEITGLVIPAKAMSGRTSGDNYANGLSGETKSCELLRFDLRDEKISGLFYEFEHNASVGGIDSKNKVLFADEMEGIASQFSGKNFANHTLFGSCFILPFDQATYSISTSTALQINYLDEDGGLIKSVQLHMQVDGGSSNSYSIWANHFYSIGTKNGDATDDSDGDGYPDDGNGDKDDPEKPATGDDDPLDISDPSGTRILTLKVNDVWEDVSLIRPTSTGSSD